jgi:hypothetical protein
LRPADFKSAASADFAIRASALPRGGSVHAGSAVAFIVSARTENRGPRRVSIPRHLDSPVNLMVKGGSLGRCLSEMRTIALHQEAAFLQNCPAGPIAARLTEPILRGLCTLHVPGCRVKLLPASRRERFAKLYACNEGFMAADGVASRFRLQRRAAPTCMPLFENMRLRASSTIGDSLLVRGLQRIITA